MRSFRVEFATHVQIWNGAVDKKPLATVFCADALDDVTAIRWARDNDVEISVRGGGHRVAGKPIAGVSSADESGLTLRSCIGFPRACVLTFEPGSRIARGGIQWSG